MFFTLQQKPTRMLRSVGWAMLPVPYHRRSINIKSNRIYPQKVDIRLVLPFHRQIKEKMDHLTYLGEYPLHTGNRRESVQVYQDQTSLIPVYFLDGEPIRQTDTVYSFDPQVDAEKYIFFSLAILLLPGFLNWRMDILHANDWHTAISVFALKQVPEFINNRVQTILSIHNLPYFGEGCQATLTDYGIPPYQHPLLPIWATHLPLPMGLATADVLIPVSPGYAKEILTPEFGYGLETLLETRSKNISGILNGINQNQWNPATDPHIPSPYDIDHLELKTVNKVEILQDLDLNPDPAIPLLILISRLDRQKGVDIALEALSLLQDDNWQAIILGSGDRALEKACTDLQLKFPDRIRSIIGFKTELSHQLYAAGDIFLMPSRYEPCGVSQLISMRYGIIPIANATGGLLNTIQSIKPKKPGTGYLYTENTPENLARNIQQAISAYNDPNTWSVYQRLAMQTDFSWENSAWKYIQKYKTLSKSKPNQPISEG